MFGTLGGPELFLVFVIALIVFGPRKLPEIGKSLGKMIAEFRRASNDLKRTIEDEVEADKLREMTQVTYGGPPPSTPTTETSDAPSSEPAAASPVPTTMGDGGTPESAASPAPALSEADEPSRTS
jgi:Tat protein translocase TatB subunit